MIDQVKSETSEMSGKATSEIRNPESDVPLSSRNRVYDAAYHIVDPWSDPGATFY
jgi:hypothetical protein